MSDPEWLDRAHGDLAAGAPRRIADRLDQFAGVYLGRRYPGIPVTFTGASVHDLIDRAEEVIDWAESV